MSAELGVTPAFYEDEEDFYPSSDGRPFAEGDLHFDLMADCIKGLRYHEEGNPKARISPDCYVVLGAGMRLRDSYKVWEENGLVPDVVFEFTSRQTRHEDRTKKWPVYERVLRVPEYFQFDPEGDYLEPRLQGFRLVNGRHVRMEMMDNRLHSDVLGLDLVHKGEEFRLFDPARGKFLFMPFVYIRHKEAESEALWALEVEKSRLRAEITALRACR